MLVVVPRMVNKSRAYSPISFEDVYFWGFVLRSTHNHTPLKYRCLFKRSVWINPFTFNTKNWIYTRVQDQETSKLIVLIGRELNLDPRNLH